MTLSSPSLRKAYSILALDHGYHAEIKRAILDLNGQLINNKNRDALCTVHFMNNNCNNAVKHMIKLLQLCLEQG